MAYKQVRTVDLRIGDRVAWLGPGYRIRTVTKAASLCEEWQTFPEPTEAPLRFKMGDDCISYSRPESLHWLAFGDEQDYTRT